MNKIIEKIKSRGVLFILFLVGFFLSFFNGVSLQNGEDLVSSTAAFKFIRNPSIIPLMADQLNAMELLAIPFYLIFGFNHVSLRIAQAFFLGLGIALFYLFIKNITDNKKVALLTSLLLSSTPYFILMKNGEYPFTGFFTITILLIFSLMRIKESKFYLILLGIVSGLAFYYKVIMGAFVFFLLVSYLILNRENARKKLWNLKSFSIFVFFVTLGALPFILWNIAERYGSTIFVFLEGVEETYLDFGSVISARFLHIREVLAGSPPRYYGEIPLIGSIVFFLFIISILYLVERKEKEFLIYPLTFFFYIAISSIQLNPIVPKHLYPILPLAITTIGLAFYCFMIEFSNKGKKIATFIFSLLVAASFYNTYRVLATDNDYNLFRTEYEIGYTFRGRDMDNIYLFQPKNHGFWNSLIFTTQQTDVFLADELFEKEGEVMVILGTWSGGQVGDFHGGRPLDLKLEDLIEGVEEKRNAYIDTKLLYKEETDFRIERRERVNSTLKEAGYSRLDVIEEVPRIDQETVYEKRHIVWVSGEKPDLISELKALDGLDGKVMVEQIF